MKYYWITFYDTETEVRLNIGGGGVNKAMGSPIGKI
jgi:hypothetical protein